MRLLPLTAAGAGLLALCATPAVAAAAPQPAYFKVSLVAGQDINWSLVSTNRSCNGSTTELRGSGTSALRVRTRRAQPAVAQRTPDGRRATLVFAGGTASVPVAGTLAKQGQTHVTVLSPGNGRKCGEPIPTAPDCGTKPYPADTTIGVSYVMPEQWPFRDDPTPLTPQVFLTGPSSRTSTRPIHWAFCPGVNGEDMLRGAIYGPDYIHSSSASLPLQKLFGKARRFKVRGSSNETVNPKNLPNTSNPITSKTSWTLTFTRLSRRPSGL